MIRAFSQLLLALSCLALAACTPGAKPPRAASSAVPIAGGFSSSDDARELQRAAIFAAREESKRAGVPIRVVKVLAGERQVVAGFNFRIRVAAQRNGATTETADIRMYRDLRGRYHLDSWRWRKR